jgi:hypothetical protein
MYDLEFRIMYISPGNIFGWESEKERKDIDNYRTMLRERKIPPAIPVCYAGDGMYSLDYSLSDGGHRRWIAASEEGHRVRVYLRRGAQVVPEKKRKKISEVKIV